MSDEPTNRELQQQITRLAEMLGSGLAGLGKETKEQLDRIENRLAHLEREFDEFRRETRDGLVTMRSEGLDMRAAVDGLKAETRELRATVSGVQTEVRELRYARSAVSAE